MQNDANMAAKWALEASWRALGGLFGALEEAWSARRRGGFQGRMGRSWTPPGAVRARKKLPSIASWPVQEEFRDWFQLSRGSKIGPGEGSKRGAKTGPRLRTAKP